MIVDKHIQIKFNFPIKNISVDHVYIYPKSELKPGYLHLLEHMLIRTNKKLLDQYEQKNNIYNALTDKKKMNFVFVHKGSDKLPIDFLDNKLFQKDDFNIEKNIIMEERKLYLDNFPSVNEVLGTYNQICEFELDILQSILNSNQFSIIHFNYSLQSSTEKKTRKIGCFSIHDNDILNSVIKNEKGYMLLNYSVSSKLIVYFLRILQITIFNFKANVKQKNNYIEITYSKNIDLSKLPMQKIQIMRIYKIYLNELRFHSQEMIYLIESFGSLIEIEKYWEEVPWERLLL